jgi:hypothetical protein
MIADDPHVEPIRPRSPLLVPSFAANLLHTSSLSRSWVVGGNIPGLAILTGPLDRYVKAAPTEATLRRNAPHFRLLSLPASRHEVDNEVDSIRNTCAATIVDFLDRVSAARSTSVSNR